MASQSIWDEFAFDPRSAQYGGLRASDADREVVHRALGNAYADGRLTREEFDQRSEAAMRARTLSELPVLVSDLVPDLATPARVPALPRDAGLEARAVAAYESDRREAAWGFVSASMVCWVIWWVTSGGGGFPWPVFVMLGTGLHLLRLLVMRGDAIQERRTRLERKAGRELGRGRRELESGDDES